MAFPFVDTNIFIRYLTRDNLQQSEQAYVFFKQVAAGELTVETSESVIVEIVQVLSSKDLYNLPRKTVQQHVENILSFRGLRLPKKATVRKALKLYATTKIDFVDCLIAAHVGQTPGGVLVSFDRDFDKLAGVNRQESAAVTSHSLTEQAEREAFERGVAEEVAGEEK